MKVSCVAWAPFSDRLDELAAGIGGSRKNINLGYLPRYAAPLKYVAYFLMTLIYLFRERPSVVYAQNPPIFCPAACIPYCWLTGARLLVDHHNLWSVKTFEGSAVAPVVRRIEAVVARTAFANTVPHSVWRDELTAMGGSRVVTVHDFLERNPNQRSEAMRRRVSEAGLIGIASGHQGLPLEAVESEARAAELTPGVTLAITGPPERLASRIEALGPLNRVKFLGYLPKQDYEVLKASSDFGLNISNEKHTVNHVLFEYAAAFLPAVSSRRPEIEAVFGDSLVYADSSEAHVVAERLAWLTETPGRVSEYRTRMASRYEALSDQRRSELARLRALVMEPAKNL